MRDGGRTEEDVLYVPETREDDFELAQVRPRRGIQASHPDEVSRRPYVHNIHSVVDEELLVVQGERVVEVSPDD